MRESRDLSEREIGEELGRCVRHAKLERKKFNFLTDKSQDRSNLILKYTTGELESSRTKTGRTILPLDWASTV
jgi:hypothetical protein